MITFYVVNTRVDSCATIFVHSCTHGVALALTMVLDLAFGAGVAEVVDVTSWKIVSKLS
jgi:hypothetical protein